MRNKAFMILVMFILMLFCLCVVSTIYNSAGTIKVTTQHGFVIDADNVVMQEACRYHGIGYDDIRWDTVNKTFIFERGGSKCHVFTTKFKKYLDKKIINKSIELAYEK